MKLNTKQNYCRLSGYLNAVVTCGTIANSANAAVITLDISSVDGLNAGLASNGAVQTSLSSLTAGMLSGSIVLYNAYNGITGLGVTGGAQVAVSSLTLASPRNFASSSGIDATTTFTNISNYTVFYYSPFTSPDFDSNSFIGFRSNNNHYGYLEVTWTAATNTFEILGGAYEDQPGVGIGAGSLVSIPEPSTAVLSLGALAAGAFIRRRKQAA